MSHTSEVTSIRFVDTKALEAAVKELQKGGLNCTLARNATPRAYYSNQAGMTGTFDYVLQLHDARFDIAFARAADGNGYVARTDFFGGSVATAVGSKHPMQPNETREQHSLGRLNQLYAVHAATRKAAQQGHRVTRSVGKDGTIRLVVNM